MLSATPKSADELARATKTSANWCFWIAGLTTVNAAMALAGSDRAFVIGSIFAQAAMQLAARSGRAMHVLALAFNVGAIAVFVLLGALGRRGQRWAFVVAFLAYAADTLLLMLEPSFLAIAFHGWALLALGSGWGAAGAWRKAKADNLPNPPPLPLPAGSAEASIASAEIEPDRVDAFARETEEMMARLYAPKHDRQPANPQDFKVDHGFYDRTMAWLEKRGFRKLGDYEMADLRGTPQDAGCFVRVGASEDGTVTVAMFHMRPQTLWLRLLLVVMTRGGIKSIDFQTEFSDGRFVCTSNTKMAERVKLPPKLDTLYLEPRTPLEELYRTHLERVARTLECNPAITVRTVRSLAEVHAAEDRQDAMKAAFRQELGGMTREELLALADTPAKREAAEQLWGRLQARKTEDATARPRTE